VSPILSLSAYSREGVILSGVNPELAERAAAGLADPRLGGMVGVLVALRSRAQQQVLWDLWDEWCDVRPNYAEWQRRHGANAPVPNLAAYPGTSKHEIGEALDLFFWEGVNATKANKILVADVLWEYGLWQSVRGAGGIVLEWWHFELDPNRGDVPITNSPALPGMPDSEDEEYDEMKPIARIYGTDPYDAQFIRFANGAVQHLGPGEIALYDEGGPYADTPKVVENDRVAYHRLVRASGTNWKPGDMPY
jgi:hypothetical protein